MAAPGNPPREWRRLGRVIEARMQRLGASVDPELAGDERQLRAALKRAGCRMSKAYVELDARYGGLVLPDGSEWHWLFGAHACLSRGERILEGKRKLVPMVIGKDAVAYMDSSGRVWAQDQVVDPAPFLYAPNADALVARTVLMDAWWSYRIAASTTELDGRHGARIARDLGVRPVKAANDATWRGWADDRVVVIQTTDDAGVSRTLVGGRGARRFAVRSRRRR